MVRCSREKQQNFPVSYSHVSHVHIGRGQSFRKMPTFQTITKDTL